MNTLEYAINMELDGEKYYKEQAEINKDNRLHAVCMKLAKDENNHARILNNKLCKMPYELEDGETFSKVMNIFKGMDNIKIEGKEIPSQLDFYRVASAMEKLSINLYTDFLSKATEDHEKELFEFLVKQEKQHEELLEELVLLLGHAEEWVESAEFGIRKEY